MGGVRRAKEQSQYDKFIDFVNKRYGQNFHPYDTVTFWSVGVENKRETSQDPGMGSSKLILGLRRSLNGKHEKHR